MIAPRASTHIGMLLFPNMTQLDFTGPYEVFSRLPETTVHIVAASLDPVRTDRGLVLAPRTTYTTCPQLDVVVVPGGPGQEALMQDEGVLGFLRQQAAGAKYVTSVCTGSLVLGAAGLLAGYRAVTHWTAMDYLALFGATPTKTRVCVDRNRITGGGVTAGIDFALTLVSILADRQTAEAIQLALEYNPAPPFNAGSPATAPPEVLALLMERIAKARPGYAETIKQAAARLTAGRQTR